MDDDDELRSSENADLLPIPLTAERNRAMTGNQGQGCFQARYILCFFTFWGFFMVYSLRVNLSVALPSMVKTSTGQNETVNTECGVNATVHDQILNTGEEFDWNEKQQGIILSSFFYGYVLTQIPGGRLSEIYGGKWLLGGGILWTSLLTLLIPLAARYSLVALTCIRVLQGLGEGVTFPAQIKIFAHWYPTFEMSTVLSIVASGTSVGIIITMPIAGVLCKLYAFDNGWPLVFYTGGAAGCIWFLFWAYFISECPEGHPSISDEELIYIQENRGSVSEQKMNIPWKKMLTSPAVISVTITKFCGSWGYYTLFTELTTFMKNIQHYSIDMNGLLNSFLYVASILTSISGGFFSDSLSSKYTSKTTVIKKSFELIAFIGPAIGLALVPHFACDYTVSTILLVASMGLYNLSCGGDGPITAIIAPQFAGTVTGVVNGLSNISGMLAPYITGLFISNQETISSWSKVFYLSSGVYALGIVVFVLFGSAEPQSWGIAKPFDDNKHENVNYKILQNENT